MEAETGFLLVPLRQAGGQDKARPRLIPGGRMKTGRRHFQPDGVRAARDRYVRVVVDLGPILAAIDRDLRGTGPD